MKDSLLKFYRTVLLPACLIFTLLCFGFSFVLFHSESSMTLPTMDLGNLTQIFVFSFLLSLSFRLFDIERPAFWVRLLLHFVAFLLNITVVFFFIGGHYSTPMNAFVVLLLFAVLYAVTATVVLVIRHFTKKKNTSKTPYRRQF